MKKILFLVVLMMMFLPSCMTTRTSVSNYRETSGEVYTYSKGKQLYLFWGLIPLGRTRVATPSSGSCEIRTSYNFWDAFLSCITGGIFEMQTIKVKAKKVDTSNNTDVKNVSQEVNLVVGNDISK